MTSEQYIKLGKQTTLVSFVIGTIIFGLYILTSAVDLFLLAYGFIIIVGLFKTIVLVSILIKAIKDKEKRKKLLITCGTILLNIPVLLIYCWIIMKQMQNDSNNYY